MRLSKTQVVALANQKGGCGKSTTAVSLAAALAREGYSTCLVDVDQQCNATTAFGIQASEVVRQEKRTVADAYLANVAAKDIRYEFGDRFEGRLHLIPGNKGLAKVEPRLEQMLQETLADESQSPLDADDIRKEHRLRLRKSIQSLDGLHDFVVIDTPPDLGFHLTSALIAADWYIIPLFPARYDLDGLESVTRTADKVKSRYNPRLNLLGVVLSRLDTRAKLDNDIKVQLQKTFGERFFKTTISNAVHHRQATILGQTVFEVAPNEAAAQQYLALAREVLERVIRATTPAQAVGELTVEAAANG